MADATLVAKLDPNRLYMGDNGRVFCGALGCAGMTAHYTGKGISGLPVAEVTLAAVRSCGFTLNEIACETCGKGVPRG